MDLNQESTNYEFAALTNYAIGANLVLLLGLEPRLTSNLEFGIISPVVLHYTTGAFGVTDWNRTSIKEFCRLLHNYSATVTKW